MDADIKENVKNTNTWIRGLFILLFAIVLGLAKVITGFVVLFQFGHVLLTRHVNERLLDFGASLALYVQTVILYLTFNTDEKPFPFSEWPGHGQEGGGESDTTGNAGNAPVRKKPAAKKKAAPKSAPKDSAATGNAQPKDDPSVS